MPRHNENTTATALFGMAAFQTIVGIYWFTNYSAIYGFGELPDLLMTIAWVPFWGLAFIARRHRVFAASFAFAIYAALLAYLSWRGFGIVVTSYLLKIPQLVFLVIALFTAFRAQKLNSQ